MTADLADKTKAMSLQTGAATLFVCEVSGDDEKGRDWKISGE